MIVLSKPIPGVIPRSLPFEVPRGCVAYWPLDDPSNAAGAIILDHSGYGHHGTNDGSVSVAGPCGRVRYFAGDDYIGIADNTALFEGLYYYSCIVWVRRDEDGRRQTFFCQNGNDGGWTGITFEVQWEDPDNLLYMSFNHGSSSKSAVALGAAGGWEQFAFVYRGDATKRCVFYVNGVQLGAEVVHFQGVISQGAITATAVAKHSTVGRSFNGQMRDLMIFNRALSATEILQNYRENAWRYRLAG